MTDEIETKPDILIDKMNNFDVFKGLEYAIESKIVKKMEYILANRFQVSVIMRRRKREQMKKIFLTYWEKSMGVISATCEKTEVARGTFYLWMKDDPVFAKKINELIDKRNTIAEDLLWGKITINKDSQCIRYYLDRKHPSYKPKMVNEVIAGDRTYEDLVDEHKKKITQAQKEYDDKQKQSKAKGPDKQRPDTAKPNDTKQEGGASTIPPEHGAGVLLEKENAPKPAIESEAKGTK